jgi:hypothetical protein
MYRVKVFAMCLNTILSAIVGENMFSETTTTLLIAITMGEKEQRKKFS